MDPNLFRYIWRNSRREQIAILLLILGSLPFYWLSLEVPKRIVNEALQGEAFRDGNTEATLFNWSIGLPEFLGGFTLVDFDGFAFDQINYLLALSFMFLGFVLINGAFKYKINIDKGVMAERILRRLRFDLFARMMRFRPEDIRQVKPAEAASMINNEVEPIGSFSGDAFVLPVFLASQALTALIFILTQSLWLGLVALAIVLVQAFVIPVLRRRQLELARQRQIAARHLSGRIGEMVGEAPLIHTHGTKRHAESDIGGRLSRLFDIRVALYKRKYAVKYLNTLLSQVTPFFFYAIGGYFALTGSLDIGQLVAVIAAYKDLPPPIKELIDWDQRRADITIKYQQVTMQFAADPLLPDTASPERIEGVARDEPIRIDGLRVLDQRGNALLESTSAIIERPGHIAVIGPASSARDVMIRTLGRQTTDYEGRILFGDVDLSTLSDHEASRALSFAPADPQLVHGTIEDNIILGLSRSAPDPTAVAKGENAIVSSNWLSEAGRTGNPTTPFEADWVDYASAGVGDRKELREHILEILRGLGMDDDLYSFGLLGRLPPDTAPEMLERIVQARQRVRERLVNENLLKIVDPFEPEKFNANSSLGGNLVFGVAAGNRLTKRGLAQDRFFRSILAAEALDRPLIEIGTKIIETTIETFADLPSGHPLFERYEMFQQSEIEEYEKLLEKTSSRDGFSRLSSDDVDALIAIALYYNERRHRLGLLDVSLEQRVLRARKSFKRFLPQEYAEEIDFYDPEKVIMAAPISDNLLFGRVAFGVANANEKVSELLRSTLKELDLLDTIYALGLEYDVGPSGSNLVAPQRVAISIARCLVSRPSVLVTEGGFPAFSGNEATSFVGHLCQAMEGRTLIAALPDEELASAFDRRLKFDGARFSDIGAGPDSIANRRETADLSEESAEPTAEKAGAK